MDVDEFFIGHLNEESYELILPVVLDDDRDQLRLRGLDDFSVDEDWWIKVVGNAQAAELEVKVCKACDVPQAFLINELREDFLSGNDAIVEMSVNSDSCLWRGEFNQPVLLHRTDRDNFEMSDEIAHQFAEKIWIQKLEHVVSENVLDYAEIFLQAR